jgi:hypothetical protein
MELVHGVVRRSIRVLEWIYTVEKRFKKVLDKTPELL